MRTLTIDWNLIRMNLAKSQIENITCTEIIDCYMKNNTINFNDYTNNVLDLFKKDFPEYFI
jgi:hypothetical protein